MLANASADALVLIVWKCSDTRLHLPFSQKPTHLLPHWDGSAVYAFGRLGQSLKEYDELGWHVSESGMTCIVRDDPWSLTKRPDSEDGSAGEDDKDGAEDCKDAAGDSRESELPPVDAAEFMLATLDDPQMEADWEEFPLFRWFGRVPESGSGAAVFGLRSVSVPSAVYDGLLIKCHG
jgi:hypothetical protein